MTLGHAGKRGILVGLTVLMCVLKAGAARAQVVVGVPSGAAGSSLQGLGIVPGQAPATSPRVDVIRSAPPTPRPAGERKDDQSAERLSVSPEARTHFQRMIASSTGALLPIFGQDLFAAPPSTFAAVTDIAPPADYVVGPGDELRIRAWGQVDIDFSTVVSREGTISIPRVGVIPVSGIRYQDLDAAMRASVGRIYKNFDLSVSLGQLRSIQVFVVGQAMRPGLYTVGSLSTLLNALFASGGPSSTGSMRSIELRRGNSLVGTFDLYDLLLKGDKSKDLRLQSGDVIFIPPVGPVAAIAGSVKNPAIFELPSTRTPISELIAYAGGTTTTADVRAIRLERIDAKLGRLVQALPWAAPALSTELRDGDLVLLASISQRFENAVTLRGHVAFPFRTEWRKGLTVSGLVPDRRMLIPEGYWARIAGLGAEGARTDTTRGAETPPTLQADIENLLAEVNWNYAVIERLDPQNLESKLIPFNLRKAVIERDPAADLALEPGDIVTIFSQKDVLPPSEDRYHIVRLEGEIAVPGIYQVRPGETLRQVLERAGGLSKDAYVFGSEFTRESVRRDQQARLDEVARRAEAELERAAVSRLSRATNPEDVQSVKAQLDQQRAALARLRALKASGRIVLGLSPNSASADTLPDIVLENGDRFFVPYRSTSIGVYGAVYAQANLIYRPGNRIGDYLDQAGGLTGAADTGSTYVLRADGSVFSRRNVGLFGNFDGQVLMPSDTIVVPEDYTPISWVRELKDWTQIFFNFGLGVAALKVLFP